MKIEHDKEYCFSHAGIRFMAKLCKSETSPHHQMMVVMISDEQRQRMINDGKPMTDEHQAAWLASGAKTFADMIRKGYLEE